MCHLALQKHPVCILFIAFEHDSMVDVVTKAFKTLFLMVQSELLEGVK
jgi:phage terminase large subunit-like protein